ncbi:MAG: hypothetical protein JW814_06930 [Candidatus Krumholzibacteriota bacterium]|nr:hypothetical protein [Candidatus Krumholzibacteriota bacterium]
MRDKIKKRQIAFLSLMLIGNWFIWGIYCPSCLETNTGEGLHGRFCLEAAEEDHSDIHQECCRHDHEDHPHQAMDSVKSHDHQKLVFTLPGRSWTGEDPLVAVSIAGRTADDFQFVESRLSRAPEDTACLRLDSLQSVVMLA